MSKTLLEFPPAVKELASQLDSLPNVEQVRVHPALKESIRLASGPNTLSFLVMVKNRTVPDSYVSFATFIPESVYLDLNAHKSVVETIKSRIQQYYDSGVLPGTFESQNLS